MQPAPKVRLLADLGLRDRVRTPLAREAMVEKFTYGRVQLRYLDGDLSEVVLAHHHLVLLRKAAPIVFSDSKILKSEIDEARARAALRNGGAHV